MKRKQEDKETRYYVDLDLATQRIIGWNYDQRKRIVMQDRTTRHIIGCSSLKGSSTSLKRRTGKSKDSRAGNTRQLDPVWKS